MEDLPDGLMARRVGEFLILDRRWWKGQPAVVVVGGVAVLAIVGLLRTRLFEPKGFVQGFHAVLLAIVLPLLYALLAVVVNRTTILVEPRSIRIRHHPLPWPGRRLYAAKGIVQFYCRWAGPDARNGNEPGFDLCALTRGGQKVTILGGLTQVDALCLERLIEDHLGIVSQPVPDEAY